jgi:itaconate CoA-transferase
MSDGPLAGLTVVAVEQAVAAPYCTARLADAGARVIKVERPQGDFARGYDRVAGGESSYFVWLNRGKQSVALDLDADEDRAILLAMTDRADVFVHNLKPGALDRKGLGVAALRERNRNLVACAISGYGDSGPYALRKAYDLLIQAESGLCSITGGPSEPARVGISIVDIATGATAHAAILEALIGRGRTGAGAEIRISMFDVMADWMTVPFLHAAAGDAPKRVGLAHPSISPYGVFTTADGRQILIAIQNDREWSVFAEAALQEPGLAIAEEFATNNARVANRALVDRTVGEAVGRRSLAALAEILLARDIAFASVSTVEGLMTHPHLTTALAMTPGGRAVTLPALAPLFDGRRRIERAAVPALDEHGDSIRAEFAKWAED